MVNRARAGYTLLETMLVVAIVGTIAGIGGKMMLQVNRYFEMTKARSDLEKEARGIMYVITRELRQAQSPSIALTRVANSQPYYSMINFTKQQGTGVTIYQNGNLLCYAAKAATFTLNSGGKLVCRTPTVGGNDTLLSAHLRYLAFTFPRTDDMTIISVSMTLQTAVYQGRTKALHMASQQVRIMD